MTPYNQRYNIKKETLLYYCNRHRKKSDINPKNSFCKKLNFI